MQRSAQAAGFAKRNRSRFLSWKVCFFAPINITYIISVHFHTLLVTRGDVEDDSFIQPCLDCDG